MPSSEKQSPPASETQLVDSPWFWVLLFSAMALVAVLVIGPKHARRQEQLERMNTAREMRGQAPDAVARQVQENVAANDSRGSLLPLRALTIVLAVVVAISTIGLVYSRVRTRSPESSAGST